LTYTVKAINLPSEFVLHEPIFLTCTRKFQVAHGSLNENEGALILG